MGLIYKCSLGRFLSSRILRLYIIEPCGSPLNCIRKFATKLRVLF